MGARNRGSRAGSIRHPRRLRRKSGGDALKACQDDGIIAYVPPPDREQRLKGQGRLGIADFRYDPAADLYRCPAGAELRPMHQASGKLVVRYASRRSVCRVCSRRERCLTASGH